MKHFFHALFCTIFQQLQQRRRRCLPWRLSSMHRGKCSAALFEDPPSRRNTRCQNAGPRNSSHISCKVRKKCKGRKKGRIRQRTTATINLTMTWGWKMAGQKGRSRCSGSKKRENSRQELERARGTLGEKCTLFSTVRQVGGKSEGVGVWIARNYCRTPKEMKFASGLIPEAKFWTFFFVPVREFHGLYSSAVAVCSTKAIFRPTGNDVHLLLLKTGWVEMQLQLPAFGCFFLFFGLMLQFSSPCTRSG